MVAYSFKAQFEEPIRLLAKRQTVRGDRKRHARPGEDIQLYRSMRTRHCAKILTPDPVCLDVRPISIGLGGPQLISDMEVDGCRLNDDDIEAFAIADGFGAHSFADGHARLRMGLFWYEHHPLLARFDGYVIRWEPR